MRSTFIYILFALAATSIAVPSGVEPAGQLLPKFIPNAEKRQVSVIHGLQSREVGGGFIAVLPKDSSFPAEGDGGSSKRRRRLLRQEEVVVPDSLQDPGSKRAIYYCEESGYGLCPGNTGCCPLGGMCCTTGTCCPASNNCVMVNGVPGCCPFGEVCRNSSECVDPGKVKCAGYNFCCSPGYICYLDSAGRNLCAPPGSNNEDNDPTTTTTTTTPVEAPTTIEILKDTTTTDVETGQTTSSDPFAVPTTTPTIAAAATNTTTSASRTSLTPDVPLMAGNGAVAVTSGMGYRVLMSAVLFALSHVLVVA